MRFHYKLLLAAAASCAPLVSTTLPAMASGGEWAEAGMLLVAMTISVPAFLLYLLIMIVLGVKEDIESLWSKKMGRDERQ